MNDSKRPYPHKNKKTTALIYGAYGVVFLALVYGIASIQRMDDNRPVIVLAEPVDLKGKDTPINTIDPTAQEITPSSTNPPPNQPTTESSQAKSPTLGTPIIGSKPTNSTVVWEMSQADPTKQPITSSDVAPSDTVNQTTIDTPTSTRLGNQAILHPDDVPASEHSSLPHLARTVSPDGKASRVEISKVMADIRPETVIDKTPNPPKADTPDSPPADDGDVLEGVEQLLNNE